MLLFHGLFCSVRIEFLALAYLFSGESLVVTCVVVLVSVFLQILAAAVLYIMYKILYILSINIVVLHYTQRKLNNHKTP